MAVISLVVLINQIRDRAIITWRRGGLGNQRAGHRGKSELERGGLDVKFTTYRGGGHYFFHSFSQTERVVEELLEFKHLYLLTLELNWENINSRCFDL